MDAISHTLNIATFAAWLSVASVGVVGLLVPDWQKPSATVPAEVALRMEEITVGEEELAAPTPPQDPAPMPESLPTPREMPTLAEAAPLPEIQDLPSPQSAQPASPKPAVRTARVAKAAPSNAVKSAAPAPAMSNAARLAAGHMPAPSYPAVARHNHQTGTVIVEFTVDAAGHVIAAFAKIPSPWPLLNAEAVRAVRVWSFPPGGVMKLQRPIVFQLR